MRKGKIVEVASCGQLFSNPQHPYTRSLLAAVPTMQSNRNAPLAATGNPAMTLEGPLVEIASGHWTRRAE
jgi:oligopeptide/dipeptide ABC transporter ATP-binding protein